MHGWRRAATTILPCLSGLAALARRVFLFAVLLLLLLLTACGGNPAADALHRTADSLIAAGRPDSALVLLESYDSLLDNQKSSTFMRHELLRARAMNKSYTPFTTDSTMLAVADWYDRHGTPNERMEARYLLGCAYRDMGEAPQALQCYQDALECADTTAIDCDYSLLMAVYGQMADLYYSQDMPVLQLRMLEQYGLYARRTGDTLKYIQNIGLKAQAYDLMGDTADMISCLRTAYSLFEANGYEQMAARTIVPMIYITISRGELDSAACLMKCYEGGSGLFDVDGRIKAGGEDYYYMKGLYCLSCGRKDSAGIYFSQIPDYKKDINACRGLLNLYREIGVVDSVVCYSALLEQAMDSLDRTLEKETMQRMSSLYDYQRSNMLASKKALEAFRLKTVLSVLSLFVCALLIWVVYRFRANKKRRMEQVAKYLDAVYELMEMKGKLGKVKQELATHIEARDILESRLNELESRTRAFLDQMPAQQGEGNTMAHTDIYRHFHILANNGIKPRSSDWESLYPCLREHLPVFVLFMEEARSFLTEFEFYVCILVRIHVKPTPISKMYNVSASYLSQIRKGLSEKLFHLKNGKPADFDSLICKIG